MPKPKAPEHLAAPTRTWWRSVVETYVLEPHHVRLLTLAGEAWDRAQEARQTLEKSGAYFETRFGEPRVHPAVAVERDSRLSFARLLRELNLDLDAPPSEDGRPPRVRGVQRAV